VSDSLIQSIATELYIGGRWCKSSGLERFEVFDPATEMAIASVAYDLIIERREQFATVISREEGKTFAEAVGEVNYAAGFLRWFAEEAVRDPGRFGRAPAGCNNILVQHRPVGVSLLITPWNFPAAMIARKIAPALAAGCTTIVKPASETPLTALLMMQLFEEAGVPPGVVNLLPSKHAALISNTILSDPRTRKLSFTGSTEVGRHLLAKAAERVINCSMELGGSAPFIVLDDADLEVSVEAALAAKIRNAGESCIGANRFYVHSSLMEDFAVRLAHRMGRLTVGAGLEPGVDIGPLVNASARDRVESLVDEAVGLGARVLTGGKRLQRRGYFLEPTVLIDIPDGAAILNTEIFGPVATLLPFDTDGQAIAAANDTEFGLAAYVCSRNVGRALAVAGRIEAGIIGINRGFVSDPAAPFGGFKQSGLGREGSQEGLYEFLETQYIAVDW
jgi:succinate-semialdehyde dehydrogenase / glutarate-semialdehyde dehydrogenase